ncbi:MAG: GGDEF domain-containing protein [Pseudomonadota bacterium]
MATNPKNNEDSPQLVDVLSDLLTTMESQATTIQALLEQGHQSLRRASALAIKEEASPNLIKFVSKVVLISNETINSISATRQQLESAHTGVRYLYEQLKTTNNVQALDIEPLLADPLTGTYNRRAMDRLFEKVLSHRDADGEAKKVVLVIADIDFLSKINEEYGREAGDMALKHFGQHANMTLRGTDHVIRYSDEEFLLIMTDTDLSGARFAVERLRDQLKRSPLVVLDKTIAVKFSAGMAALPADVMPEESIKDAFSALHAAKQSGRNCLKIASLSSQNTESE